MSEVTRPSAEELPPIDKAAILMLAMGEDEAANVLAYLEPREVQRVGAAMSALGRINAQQMDGVVNHFLETVSGEAGRGMGANDYLRKMLIGALRGRRAGSLLDRLVGASSNRLGKHRWMGCRAVADFIFREPLEMQAIALSYLEPAQAAEVLAHVPEPAVWSDLIIRVAGLTSTPAAQSQDTALTRALPAPGRAQGSADELGGKRAAADIVRQMTDHAAEAVIAGIRERDETLAEEILALVRRSRAGRPAMPPRPAESGRASGAQAWKRA